jgi:hypothetical protein
MVPIMNPPIEATLVFGAWFSREVHRIYWLALAGDVLSPEIHSQSRDSFKSSLGRNQWRFVERQHRKDEERWLPFAMVHRIGGDVDVRRGVVCEYRVAAVRVADTTRKIAASDIDLQSAAYSEGMMDIAKMNRWRTDLVRRQVLGSGRGIPIHRPHHSVHKQHRTAIRVQLDQLCHKIRITTV